MWSTNVTIGCLQFFNGHTLNLNSFCSFKWLISIHPPNFSPWNCLLITQSSIHSIILSLSFSIKIFFSNWHLTLRMEYTLLILNKFWVIILQDNLNVTYSKKPIINSLLLSPPNKLSVEIYISMLPNILSSRVDTILYRNCWLIALYYNVSSVNASKKSSVGLELEYSW